MELSVERELVYWQREEEKGRRDSWMDGGRTEEEGRGWGWWAR